MTTTLPFSLAISFSTMWHLLDPHEFLWVSLRGFGEHLTSNDDRQEYLEDYHMLLADDQKLLNDRYSPLNNKKIDGPIATSHFLAISQICSKAIYAWYWFQMKFNTTFQLVQWRFKKINCLLCGGIYKLTWSWLTTLDNFSYASQSMLKTFPCINSYLLCVSCKLLLLKYTPPNSEFVLEPVFFFAPPLKLQLSIQVTVFCLCARINWFI